MSRLGYGNCPVCRLAVKATKARGLTPPHGWLGRRNRTKLPPCPGSGLPAANVQHIAHQPSGGQS